MPVRNMILPASKKLTYEDRAILEAMKAYADVSTAKTLKDWRNNIIQEEKAKK